MVSGYAVRDGSDQPVVPHLRLGQALLEQGEQDRAADELIRAYMGGGPELFERDDPKYLAFLSTRARLN